MKLFEKHLTNEISNDINIEFDTQSYSKMSYLV